MSDLKIARESLEGLTNVSDHAIRFFLGSSAGKAISGSCDGSETEKEDAKKARHKIWLSFLPGRFTLLGSLEDRRVVALATGTAILDCTCKPDESGRDLIDRKTVDWPELQRKTGTKAFNSAFNTSVFFSLPKTIYTRMMPAQKGGLSTPENWAHDGVPDYQELYDKIASDLESALGPDASEYRHQIIQHVIIHQLNLNDDGIIGQVESQLRWPIAYSLEIYGKAKTKVATQSE